MTPLLFFSLFSFHGQQVGVVGFAGTWRDGLGYSRLWFGSASAATLLPIRFIWIAKLMKIMGKCARMLANSCWCCENWLSMLSRACLPPEAYASPRCGVRHPIVWRSPRVDVAFAIRSAFSFLLISCLDFRLIWQHVFPWCLPGKKSGKLVSSRFFAPFSTGEKHERGEETRLKNRVWLKLDTWTKVNET